MTSKKQMDYIIKLADWKGVSIDEGIINTMSDAQASEYIDQLKAKRSTKRVNRPANAESSVSYEKPNRKPLLPAVKPYNPIQMGMVKKLVASKLELEWIGMNPKEFAKECEAVYEAFEAADELVKQLHPEVV